MSRAPIILACLFALAALAGASMSAGTQQAPVAATSVRFQAIEVWIDTASEPLAAYQIEFKPAEAFTQAVKIVGIEGGPPTSIFAAPPYYDPAAMQHERVVIAAFSTAKADTLPRGRTRIATIHVQISGPAEPEFQVRTMAAATIDGREIQAEASATPAK